MFVCSQCKPTTDSFVSPRLQVGWPRLRSRQREAPRPATATATAGARMRREKSTPPTPRPPSPTRRSAGCSTNCTSSASKRTPASSSGATTASGRNPPTTNRPPASHCSSSRPASPRPAACQNNPSNPWTSSPTLAELAGLPAPRGPQPIVGLSRVPVLCDPAKIIRDPASHCYPRGPFMGRAIRTQRHRLVE